MFKKKFDANGQVDCHKARIVAQGFSQKFGIDFTEVFAPVAKLSSIRCLVALAAHFGLALHQMDVKTAFLNGDLDEIIFMKQPEGFIVPGKENLVCRLNKSLYGLKQSGRAWYAKIDATFRDLGCVRMEDDNCVYRLQEDGLLLVICLYVDDILIASNSLPRLNMFKKNLSKCFDMKDLGEARFVLGIEIIRSPNGSISISQRAYAEALLAKHGMDNCNPVDVPVDPHVKLTKTLPNSPQSPSAVKYQSIVGGIMYLMLGSRPDLAYAITTLSQYASNPSETHWTALKRVLRYISGTLNLTITYSLQHNTPLELCGFTDSDWGSDLDDRRSIGGYLFLIAGGVVSWQSKKQPTVALSTTEAEYMAATQACKEALWWRSLLHEISLGFQVDKPTTIHSDNQSCIALSINSEFHARTKHIDIQHHFIREKVSDRSIVLKYVSTDDMVADILTKGLPKAKFYNLLPLMGMNVSNREAVNIQ